MSEIKKVQQIKPPKTNWPQTIEVELPCECCGEMVKVPFRVKVCVSFNDVHWPHYLEYKSPTLTASTCPKCRKPFRLNRPVQTRQQ